MLLGKTGTQLQTKINAVKGSSGLSSSTNPMGSMPSFKSLESNSNTELNESIKDLAEYLSANNDGTHINYGVAEITTSASPLDFGDVPAGRSKESSTVAAITFKAKADTNPVQNVPNYEAIIITGIQTSDPNFLVVPQDCLINNASTSIPPGGSCTIQVKFAPQSVQKSTNQTVFFSHNGLGPQQVGSFQGNAFDPAPVLRAGDNFEALSRGFAVDTGSSKSLCATVFNDGRFDVLDIDLLALINGTIDNRNYYEIDASAGACASPPVRCIPSGSASLTGTFKVGPGGSCTLAVKFNPSKFGVGGGTGTRWATMQLIHKGPARLSPSITTLKGSVTASPLPLIGVSTNPSADTENRVLPSLFASQVAGTTSAAWSDFTVSNTGTSDGLRIASVTHSNPTEFSLTESCTAAGALAQLSNGGRACQISLVFKPLAEPTSLGLRCTTVTIHSDMSGLADERVDVCGTSVPTPVPSMTVDPTFIDFGRRSIGAVYSPRALVIGNKAGATAALQIRSVSISSAGFTWVPDSTACAGRSLAAGTSCSLALQFTPSDTPDTPYSADIVIDTNDPITPRRTVRLSATAVASAVPVLQWQSGLTGITFSDLVVAGQSTINRQVARLLNVGPGTTDVQSIRFIGADASSFSTDGCPAQLLEGESCDIRVSFLPGSGGTKQAHLQITSAGGVAPDTLPVRGQAVGGSAPYLLVSQSSLAFGDVRVGALSDPVELRLIAAGDGVVTVNALTVDGPFEVALVSCPTPPFTLRIGSDCTVAMRYRPNATTTTTGTLTIAAEAPASALTVALEGRTQPSPDVSSGGCSMANGRRGVTDPILWLLVLAAAAVLWHRRQSAATQPAITNQPGGAR